MSEQRQESQFMREYVVYLDIEPRVMLILALNFEEAYEIAYERWGSNHVTQIVLHHTELERAGGNW